MRHPAGLKEGINDVQRGMVIAMGTCISQPLSGSIENSLVYPKRLVPLVLSQFLKHANAVVGKGIRRPIVIAAQLPKKVACAGKMVGRQSKVPKHCRDPLQDLLLGSMLPGGTTLRFRGGGFIPNCEKHQVEHWFWLVVSDVG